MRSIVRSLEDLWRGGGVSYHALAEKAYRTHTPTRAQLSATRRSVKRLVEVGVAELVDSPQYPGAVMVRPGPDLYRWDEASLRW